jgi:hypothetical protein
MTDWRDKLRDLGFGNQAVIVGTKRRELFDEIEKMIVERQKVLELIGEWIPNPLGEINSYTEGRKDERNAIRQQIKEMK